MIVCNCLDWENRLNNVKCALPFGMHHGYLIEPGYNKKYNLILIDTHGFQEVGYTQEKLSTIEELAQEHFESIVRLHVKYQNKLN